MRHRSLRLLRPASVSAKAVPWPRPLLLLTLLALTPPTLTTTAQAQGCPCDRDARPPRDGGWERRGTVRTDVWRPTGQPGEPYSPPPPALSIFGRGRERTVEVETGAWQFRPGIWQGFYVGGMLGYGSGGAQPSGAYDRIGLSGSMMGLYLGHNWQMRDLVLGVEGDLAWHTLEGQRGYAGAIDVRAQSTWGGSLRLRAGYAMDNVLLYLTAGYALSGLDVTIRDGAAGGSDNRVLNGVVLGLGVEARLTERFSARLEVLHTGFDDRVFALGGRTLPIDMGVTTVRAGLTYKLD